MKNRDALTCGVCTTAAGDVTVAGNTRLGSSSSDNLTVNSSTHFNAPVQVQTELTMSKGSMLNVSGSTVLGSDSMDTVTVNGVTIFKSAVAFQGPVLFPNGTTVPASGNTTLGSSSQDLLTVNALATFTAAVQVNTDLYVNSLLTAGGSAVLGNNNSDQLIINAAATFYGPAGYRSDSSSVASSSVIQFFRRLGSGPVTTGTVLGTLLFTGYDGAVDGTAAQIRSVYTVSFQPCMS